MKKLSIEDIGKAFKMPSDREIKTNAKNWFKNLYGVKFSDWNKELLQHTYPLEYATLEEDELLYLVDGQPKYSKDTIIKKIEIVLDTLKKQGYKSFFPKMISRSPKDYLVREDNTMTPLKSAFEIGVALIHSLRCAEDNVMLSSLKIDNNLIIRPFIEIDPKTEWRCFIKGNELIGISRYYYHSKDPIHDPESVKTTIIQFIEQTVIPNIIVTDFVADVIIAPDSPILLETNPYGLSDPCLFESYEYLEQGPFDTPKFLH